MKKKVDQDISFIRVLKGLKKVGSEEGVDYYHVSINDYGAFVVEVDHNSNTIDLILTPIVEVGEDFVNEYLENHRDDVCINLQYYIKEIVDFLDAYKDSSVPYYGLLEMVKIVLNNHRYK